MPQTEMAQTEWGGEVGSLRIKLVKTHKVFFKNLHYLTKQNKKVIKKMNFFQLKLYLLLYTLYTILFCIIKIFSYIRVLTNN